MNILQYYYVLDIILILILVLQAIVQPFCDITHNIITVLFFYNLVVIINLINIRAYSSVLNKGYATETHILQWMQTILVYMPLLVATIWLIKKLIKKCFMKVKCLKKSLYQPDAIPAVVCLCLIIVPVSLILLFDSPLLKILNHSCWSFYGQP